MMNKASFLLDFILVLALLNIQMEANLFIFSELCWTLVGDETEWDRMGTVLRAEPG